MWLALTLLGIGAFGASGLLARLRSRHADWSQRLAASAAVAAALCGLTAAFAILLGGVPEAIACPGPAPAMTINLRIGPLAAFFLVPIFLLGALNSVYGLGYWKQSRHPRNGHKLQLWYGFLIAGMAMLTLCQNSICFMFAWEIMALSIYFLIVTEDQKPAARQAGWIYLIATHLGTLLLLALFVLLRVISGSFLLRPLIPGQAGVGMQTLVFLLALGGFGIKAGIMPMHFWLPEAHANAPSHVSATLSGVSIKMGIFGLLRILTLLPARPPAWGMLVMVLGATSAFLGVLWAIGQHDLKKLLAYHSVENIGIILLGLGLALMGETEHRPAWIVLGMAGCLLHVWNHGLFKSLLFLAAGSVIHATGTRDIDRLGGLAKSMRITTLLFMLGAIAICGLPPLNGFISELFIYLGLLRTIAVVPIIALAAIVLAMVGALAAACFTKAVGAVFLGMPRTVLRHAHEAGTAMWIPMAILAAGCALIGLAPALVLNPLDRATTSWAHAWTTGNTAQPLPVIDGLVPIGNLMTATGVLVIALVIGFFLQRVLWRDIRRGPTWDCGYAAPSNRMQYTASSLAQMLLATLRPLLRLVRRTPRIQGVFAAPSRFETEVREPVLKDILEPGWRRLQGMLANGQVFQQGSVQHYLFYMLLILLVLLAFTLPLGALWNMLF